MKRLMTATAVVALLAGVALAQNTPNTGSSGLTMPPAVSSMPTPVALNFVTQQADRQWLASDIVGATVYGPQDANIGSVNDLLTGDDGKIAAAVIGVGGFLGIGQKNVAINFDALTKSLTPRGDVKLTLAATADQLKAAPDFKTRKDLDRARTATSAPSATSVPMTPPAPK